MKHTGYKLKDEIRIEKLYSVHYFEFSSDYVFPGEKHNFWELVYVDKGEIICVADDKQRLLSQGEVIFHKPNEWHSMHANGFSACNVAVVSFSCSSEVMTFFEGKVMQAGQEQKKLISGIVSEYTNSFSTPLDDVYSNLLVPKESALLCSQQLLKNYICEFLILFLRKNSSSELYASVSLNHSDTMLNILLNYMSDNITSQLTLSELAKYAGTNPVNVNRVFNLHLGCSPIRYFNRMKISLAKKYLREKNYNISQIAEMLGYNNVHYFSSQFKSLSGMSPTEYCASIKAISDIALGGNVHLTQPDTDNKI